MLPGIGIFGTGVVAKVLVPLLREKGFHIEAMWGRTIKEAEECSKELSIPFFTNKIDDVLLRKDVDLVFIICPPYLHSQISVKALGIGKHVVCDKPFGLCQSDALKMVRASQYYPSLISLVNHSLRFLPAFSQMKKHIKDGYVGKIALIDVRVQMGSLLNDKFDWLSDAIMGGGALNLIGSHVIDLMTFLTGKRAQRIHGVVKTYTKTTEQVNGIRQISAPDFTTFQMELEDGILVTATLHSHISSNIFTQEVLVCGQNGHLIVRAGDLFGLRTNKIMNEKTGKPESKEEVIYLDVQDLQCLTSDTLLPRPYIKGLCKMVTALRDAFLGETGWVKEPVMGAATFDDGLYVQAVLDAIRKSSEDRTWVKVNIMTESPTNQTKILNAAKKNFFP